MARYFIRLAYNGSNYNGWQVQDNAPTVQAELNKALSTFLRQTIETLGCGRTDTGVHAKDFYAHFDFEAEIEDLTFLTYKLNRLTPPDIAIKEIFKVDNQTHARFSALEREYQYYITTQKDAFTNGLAWYYTFGQLDVELMNQAAALLIGEHDFKAFCKAGSDVSTTMCTITYAHWAILPEGKLVFTIRANRFLRNMVRAIVGTLVDVGAVKLTIAEFKSIIESQNRSEAGQSAPAEGLYLTNISYLPQVFSQR